METKDYPKTNLQYSSSHPGVIQVNNQGIITAIRSGESIISVHGLDSKGTKLKVIAVSNNGLINKYFSDIEKISSIKSKEQNVIILIQKILYESYLTLYFCFSYVLNAQLI